MIAQRFLDHFWDLPVHHLLALVGTVASLVIWIGTAITGSVRKRHGESWPVVDGRVVSHDFTELAKREPSDPIYLAVVTYSYRVGTDTDGEYYYDRFTRGFDDGADAGAWLRSLEDKPIPVHVRPGKPGESMVLTEDLENRFGRAREERPAPALQAAAAKPGARFPRRLFAPTRWAAWAATACFCTALYDHVYRLLAARPAHPQIQPVLWAILVFAGLPFWWWYHRNTGISFAKGAGAGAPFWMRTVTRLLTLYVGCEWIFRLLPGDWMRRIHLRPEWLDPMQNGAMLALAFGLAAGTLFAVLEQTEDPSNPGTWSMTSE